MSALLAGLRRQWVVALVVLLQVSVLAAGARDEGKALPGPAGALAGPAVVRLWDTGAPLKEPVDTSRRAGWRQIAAGSAARPQGDLVVETGALAVVFASRLGKVLLHTPGDPARDKAALSPIETKGKPATLRPRVETGPAEGTISVLTEFRASGGKSFSLCFSLSNDRVLSISPQGAARGVSISSPIELAIAPSFVGDDLIFDPRDYRTAQTLTMPAEHMLLGLLHGENSMLVMTWQDDAVKAQLTLKRVKRKQQSIASADFVGGRSLSLAVLSAAGIWHREPLKPGYLERDVAIRWRPPFPATWLTQLYEDEVKTTFEFREAKEEVWRGGVGSYAYPAWFLPDRTVLSLGKRIPPKGEAVIYFLERNEGTPEQVVSPIDIAEATLSGDALAYLLDEKGRPTWYPERPDFVIGAATCGVTDQLKEIFDQGREVEEQARVKGGVEDMYYYLEGMFERDGRYYPFGKSMLSYLDAQKKQRPQLLPFIREMRGVSAEVVTTYDRSRDTIRDMKYAHELGAQTIALAEEKRAGNAERMVELKQDWTGMGGALEELARKEHTLTRKLAQRAGYRAAVEPDALPLAEEIRKRARACLDRPGSYEVWVND